MEEFAQRHKPDGYRGPSRPAVVPAISGRAWITGFHQLVVDPSDPLSGGFTLPDTWGSGRREGTLNASAGAQGA